MAFLGSPAFIYNKMKWGGYGKDITERDIMSLLMPIQQLGMHWSPDKKKLVSSHPAGMSLNTPWVHERQGNSKRCGLDHQVCFNVFGIIPPRCLECWKTVVTPRTFEELLKLGEVQKDFNFPCKHGIEVRDYTPKHYGGYHYADSLDEGLEMHSVVKKAVTEHLGKEVGDGVILKRGCTEYEIKKGPSPAWHMTPEEERILNIIELYVADEGGRHGQSREIKDHVMQSWFVWAHMNGDFSYVPFNGGHKLWADYVRYDDKDKATIKQEMALAKAAVLDGVDGKDATRMLKDLLKSANKYGVNPNAVLDMGHNTRNPLALEPTLIGDHDEQS